MPPLPPALLRECPELQTIPSDTLEDVLRTHIVNMDAANKCKLMHDALVNRLRELEQHDN